MWIKAKYDDLLRLSEAMCTSPAGSVTKYLFDVQNIEGFGYSKWEQERETKIDFEYEIVNGLPITEKI